MTVFSSLCMMHTINWVSLCILKIFWLILICVILHTFVGFVTIYVIHSDVVIQYWKPGIPFSTSHGTKDGTNDSIFDGYLIGILLGAEFGTVDGDILGSDDGLSLGQSLVLLL